jgi:hypothetical protein
MRKYNKIYITHNDTAIRSRLDMYCRCTQQLSVVTFTGTQVTVFLQIAGVFEGKITATGAPL